MSLSNFLVKISVDTLKLTSHGDIRVGDVVSICFESNNKLSASVDVAVQASTPCTLHINQTLSIVCTADVDTLQTRNALHEKFYLILRRQKRAADAKGYVGVAFASIPYER